jgi:hypothetical protein
MKGLPPYPFIARWTAGFGVSVVLIWAITAVFSPNVVPEQWSPELARNVRAAGWTVTERTEGWASSSVGEFGLLGVSFPSIRDRPKVLIWGDSFIEAVQVADDEKMHRRLSRLLETDSGLEGVGIGEPWWSVADHLFRIPAYEAALKHVRLHVIHLYSLEDTLPDQYPGARVSLFLSEPDLHFEKYDNESHELESPRPAARASDSLYRMRLHFFLHLRTRLARIARLEGLRFAPGIQRPSAGEAGAHRAWNRFLDPAWSSSAPPEEAWRFLLRELDAATDVPILFVYAPPTPALDHGRMVFDNPEKPHAARFASLCREQGFGFLSLEDGFVRFVGEAGRFPKGFQNSRPWEGHYNSEGHRLAAEAIHEWIQENRHVVHPD